MSPKTVYLITGANRGIGYGLAEALAKLPDTIVFAGARDPSAASLKDLTARYPNVHAVKVTSASPEDNQAAIAEIEKKAGQLDVIIANAGISKYYGLLAKTPLDEFREHWNVNTLGPVVLFQAAHELLLKSPSGSPIFAIISTAGGSIGNYFPMTASAYGSSKAASNFLTKVLHDEHAKEGLISMAINPGWVSTDMGNGGAKAMGMEQAPVTLDASVTGILSRVVGATREKSGGKFFNYARVKSDKPWDIDSDEIVW